MSDDLTPEALEIAFKYSQLPAEDQQRFARLIELSAGANRAVQAEATAMMLADRDRGPPANIDEHRSRIDAMIAFLEQTRDH